MNKNVSRHLLFILIMIAVTIPVLAQGTGGRITGRAVDESGGSLPGVTVTATNRATGATRSSVTGGDGIFTIPLVPVGLYEVSGELSGFRPFKAENVTVNIGGSASVDIRMRVGLEESVTVTASSPLVETTRSEISSVVNEKMVANLPTNGRNFIDFVLTTPGVVKDVRAGDISFAGQRGTLNSLVVDGANNDNTFFGQALGRTGSGRAPYQFSQDAVKEFEVNSNAYSAEYGRAGGAVINVVTKSGTNSIDGTAFYFLRDRDFNANDYINEINNRPKGPYHFDQYGASLGGPIVRDRHFFFLNYDAQRNDIENLVVFPNITYPTDPDTQAGLARLRELGRSFERNQDQDVYLLKTDHELGRSNRLSLRFNRQDFVGKNYENTGPTTAEEHTGDSLVQTDTYTGSLTTPFSSSFFNEFRAQYARDHEPGQSNSENPEATVRQGGQVVLVIGRNFFSPRETTIKRTQVADTATFLLGNHTVKGGFDVNKDEITNFFPGNFRGVYLFQSIASFQRGTPSGSGERYTQAFAGPGTTGPTTTPNLLETALFVQDEWRMTSNLTVNAGVRYDRQGIEQPDTRNPDAQLAAAGIDTSLVPEDDNNIGLRAGLAWTPGFSSRTVVRAGYGTFYGRTPAIMIGTAHSNNGVNVQTYTFTGSAVPTYPNYFQSIPTGGVAQKPSIIVFNKDFENPMVHQFSVGGEHGLTDDFSVGVNYQYVKGEDLPRSIDINVGEFTTLTVPNTDITYRQYSLTRPFANFSRIIEFQSSANSEYNGVTLDLNRRFTTNWQARLAYTYSTVKDDRPDATAVVPFTFDDAKFAQDPLDLDGDWAYGDNDVRHRVVLSGLWNFDNGTPRQNRLLSALLDGWTLSGIASYQTGQPYSALMGFDLNRDGNFRNDRAPGFERNSFRLPDQFSIDPRITKDFQLAGDLHMQLIAEAFNVLNEDNVNFVRNTYYSNTFQPLNNFGEPTGSSGPRIVQLAAKLRF